MILRALILMVFATGAFGQSVPKAFIIDKENCWQWREFKSTFCEQCTDRAYEPLLCEDCQIKKRSKCEICAIIARIKPVCQTCAATRRTLDPHLRVACPQCNALGTIECVFCKSRGKVAVVGGHGDGNKCPCCKSKGRFKCSLCKGNKTVDVPKIRRKDYRKASRADLAKQLEGLKAARKKVRGLGIHSGTDQQKVKHYTDRAKKMKAFVPAAVIQSKGLAKVMKALAKVQRFETYPQFAGELFQTHRESLIVLVDHHIKLTDLALKRVIHNDKVLAAKKAAEEKAKEKGASQ